MTPTNLRRFTVTETREAVEVMAGNLDEVAAWCGGTVVEGDKRTIALTSQTGRGLDLAHAGDLIVRRPGPPGSPSSRVVLRDEFERDLLPHWTKEKT